MRNRLNLTVLIAFALTLVPAVAFGDGIEDGLAEVFGIKLNRVGGLTKAARMRDVALAHGVDMFVMATGGSLTPNSRP